MKVYVTYYRYDRNENYDIYEVSKNKKEVIKNYRETHLPEFLEYGPDDVSYLILKEVDLTKSEYDKLVRLSKSEKDYDTDVIDFMTDIHEMEGEEIFYVSGELNWDVLNFFMNSGLYCLDDLLGEDTDTLDEDELYELCQERLWYDSEDNIFRSVLNDFLEYC